MADGDEHRSFGHRVAALLARNAVDVRSETLRMEGAHKDQWLTAWMERTERELAPIVESLLGEMRDDPATPRRWRDLIARGTKPTHSVDFWLNALLTVFAGVAQIGALTAPFAQNEINTLWPDHALKPADIGSLAAAAQKRIMSLGDTGVQAAQQGYGAANWELMVDAGTPYPDPGALLTMFRRSQIDEGQLVEGLRRAGLVDAFVAAFQGLAYGPPSAQDAILGVVQNHLDETSAQLIMAANGVDPANYPWLYDNAGRPPGPMEMLSAWNRGVAGVDQSVVEQSVRESDIKDKYIDVIVGLREHLLPQKTIVAGVHQGVIDDATALAELLKLGISPQNAGFLIAEGHNTKTSAHKALSASQIETAYEDGSLTLAQAQSELEGLGYAAADATFILNLVDVKWQQALHNASVSRVRAEYVAGRITRTTASNDLDAIGVSAAHRDLYLTQWDIVAATPTRALTEAQALRAYRQGLITQAQFETRLAAMGLPAPDIALIVAMEPVHLTESQVVVAFAGGFVSEADTRARLTAMGYAPADINVLINENAPPATSAGA